MSAENVFEVRNIKKYFGSTHANDDVSLTIPKGHVRGLIGENGSGKSTLISMIAGIQKPDSGEMLINGQSYCPQSPLDSGKHKIGTVVQELGLVDGLPVGINLFLGRAKPFTKFGVIDTKGIYREANRLLKEWGFPWLSATRLTGTLSVEEKKIVELVRALSLNPDLLILDEITQALSLNNRRILIDIIGQLKKNGQSVLLVTHDVEEMVAITDAITIMRDGKIVAQRESRETDAGEIKKLMVGRDMSGDYYRKDETASFGDEVVLRTAGLTAKDCFSNVSFDLHRGEILGVCGLSDAGIHELAEALFGVRKTESGSVVVTKSNTAVKTPSQAMRLKMGYVPKDRDKQALMVNDSIENNVVLPAIEQVRTKAGIISTKLSDQLSEKVIEKFNVKTKSRDQAMRSLSGGNRQKVNLGRWMIQDKDILILDCPTRGVDIGVKSYIYGEMRKAKEDGISMIVVSDELPELLGMCDTLLVMKDGEIVKAVSRGPEFTEETIIEVML
ncbi:MAG: sugar ABC transporter ATP-binding protein [Clostridiales bacterium]|nr:sugar ABC transporter ATP-binding protein [Clostridiales bacterium]